MNTLILAAGKLKITPQILRLAKTAQLIIAADSGLRHAEPLKITPQVIIGDFDSVTNRSLSRYPKIKKLSFPKKKDKLDLELALDYALKQATEVKVLGATGGRLDQTLAAIFIAAKISRTTKISLHSGFEDVFFLNNQESLELNIDKGRTFSLLSLGPSSSLSLSGCEYELENYQLEYGIGKGISNVARKSPLRIDLHSGQIAVIVSYEI